MQQQQLITASVFFVLACVDCRDCSVGHKGKFGHEFLEFEFRPDGLLRYANNSNYKRDTMIRVRWEAKETQQRSADGRGGADGLEIAP